MSTTTDTMIAPRVPLLGRYGGPRLPSSQKGPMMLDHNHLAGLLGEKVAATVDLGARHSWTVHRVILRNGADLFVKAARECPGVFAAEAAGLRWLAGPETSPAVPEVVAADEHVLVLPWLAAERPTAVAAERFGRELAAIHTRAPAHFGAHWSGFIADIPMDNTTFSGPWPRWFAERRLLPLLPAAAQYLDSRDMRVLEKILDHIDDLAGPVEPPARIHGDLWSGNIVWTRGRGILIDPAAHGGHRETDLAMLRLFGTPHLDRILAAYHEITPLAQGWQQRVPLHQLHPLLVHVALFGHRYRDQLITTAHTALANR